MHLIQIILPLYADGGEKLDRKLFDEVKAELLRQFGGVTAFTRAPAEGLWDAQDAVHRDDVLLYEVLAESLDRDWWAVYRMRLEARFRQQEILMRALPAERL
jgi:hypothetical protein